MSSATLDARDAFQPQRPPGMRAGLVLALVAHALLVAALAWSVRWRTSEPEGVEAELWSATPQIAAPRAIAPEPVPPLVRPTPPLPTPPKLVEAPRPDPQIAIAKAERERERAERNAVERDKQKRDEARRLEADQARAAEALEKKKLAEKARQDASRVDANREANLKRMMAQAGGATGAPADKGNAKQTSGPSAGYAGRIKARIKPNIVLTAAITGNPLATVEVRLAPDGTVVGRTLVRSSGSSVWDETVLRAIDKTEVLPRDVDGRVPSSLSIEFKPFE